MGPKKIFEAAARAIREQQAMRALPEWIAPACFRGGPLRWLGGGARGRGDQLSGLALRLHDRLDWRRGAARLGEREAARAIDRLEGTRGLGPFGGSGANAILAALALDSPELASWAIGRGERLDRAATEGDWDLARTILPAADVRGIVAGERPTAEAMARTIAKWQEEWDPPPRCSLGRILALGEARDLGGVSAKALGAERRRGL